MSTEDSTEAMARRILESVMRQLESGAGRPSPASPINQAINGTGGSPVIIIMLGDAQAARIESNQTARPLAALPTATPPSSCGCQNNSHTPSANSLQSSHPGLERFELPEENFVPNVPRRCFIEPERPCVGSGACEMRGY